MFEWLSELAREKLYLNTGIHISGNKELIIDNCRRIEEYDQVYMRIVAGGLTVDIRGNDLRAYDFSTGGLVIRGCIEQISLTERRNRREAKEKNEDKCQREEAL